MKEEDIRRDSHLREVAKLHSEDVKEIIKSEPSFVHVNCPACGNDSSIFLHQKEGFSFDKCTNCQTVFINPRPSEMLLKDFYSNSKSMRYWNDVIFPETEEKREKLLFQERVNRIISFICKYNIPTNTLMDVGAGFGTFCFSMQKEGLFESVIAVESSKKLALSCKNRGINTIARPIEEVEIEKADVITSFEVIEHLYDPIKFVKSCYKTLSRNGLLILTTPNVRGFELSMLKTLSPNYGGPDHLNYYHPKSLQLLVENNGFKTLEILTPGKLDVELVRKKILNKELVMNENWFLEDILVNQYEKMGEAFQKFIVQNHLSSHMWIIAQKF